jgi:hypothetical protein
MKRIVMLVVVALVMAALVLSASPGFADPAFYCPRSMGFYPIDDPEAPYPQEALDADENRNQVVCVQRVKRGDEYLLVFRDDWYGG